MNSQDGIGSMTQLKALGPQNEATCAFPSVSPFIRIYRQHQVFSRFQHYTHLPNYTPGDTIIINIDPKNHGDLSYGMMLKFSLPELDQTIYPGNTQYVECVGHAILKTIQFRIGTAAVETISGDWLELWDGNNLTDSQYEATSRMLGGRDPVNLPYGPLDIYVPLRLFFEQQASSGLPLCALSHQPIQLRIETRSINHLVKNTTTELAQLPIVDVDFNPIKMTKVSLISEEVLLDDNLQSFFMYNTQTYLIHTNRHSQHGNFETHSTMKYYPDINSSVSCFHWIFRTQEDLELSSISGNNRFNFSVALLKAKVFLINEFVDEDKIGSHKYWRYLQPLMYLNANPRREVYTWSQELLHPVRSDQTWGVTDFSRVMKNQFFFKMFLNATGYKIAMFMDTVNYMTIENGSIKSLDIY